MLDCRRVSALRIRLPESRRDVLLLEPGVHVLTPATLGAPASGTSEQAVASVYVDSRGVWMQVRDGVRGAYVNGRPVRHMALLRAGDSLFLHGHEVQIVGREPDRAPVGQPSPKRASVRCVLRAIGGPLHGRCFSLARRLSIGNAADCDVRIDDARVAARHVELAPLARGVSATTSPTAGAVGVNGHRVEDALMLPGDQLVLAGTHRFVIEAPRASGEDVPEAPRPRPAADAPARAARRRGWRIPWLLLAAVLLAAALSLLLLYGAG